MFDVLVYLLQHRDRVVPKEELMDEMRGDPFVSETAGTSRIKHGVGTSARHHLFEVTGAETPSVG